MRILLTTAVCAAALAAEPPSMPMPVNYADVASTRWLQKKVLESRPLDNMESTTAWEVRGKGEMSLTAERFKDGSHSLRLRAGAGSPDEKVQGQRMFGTASVYRKFPGEDWSRFNRVSLWVYPDLPGWRVVTIRIKLHNDGKVKVPAGFYPVYQAWVIRNHAWNQVVWEITDLPRDRVVGVEFECRRQGHEPEASDVLSYDIDQLELQRVDPDQYEGWQVAPGRLAFSHTGYPTGAPKQAFAAADLAAKDFQIVRQESGEVVLSRGLQRSKTPVGEFQVMDFSAVREPGTYVIRTGGVTTRPFRIAGDVWSGTIWKAINFFYVERCGIEIPGVHRACHRDWQVIHGDRRIVINGGWHDAGDLSQGLVNTAETVYAMFALAERLHARGEDEALYRRLVEEARWGLDWVLRTSFGDGYRVTWATMGPWTNGILGDYDDVTAQAQDSPYENFLASAAEAIGARVLRNSDPDLAAYSLKRAREDFKFGTAGLAPAVPGRGRTALVETASAGILSALDLYRLTGDGEYREQALRLAPTVINSQQRAFLPGLEVPITGFFYTSPERDRLLHYLHRGHEQAPVVALSKLCETFPDHPDWMEWYSGVVLHSEFYQKAMSAFTAPYRMLPNSIHKADEYLRAPERQREAIRQQILNGFKVGGDYYVRAYPVQPEGTFRGNYGTLLSQTKAVTTAAHLRGSLDLAGLSQEQVYWVLGRNPFAQSTMYGEGYDYQPQYSAMSGDIVGSLPVGIKSRENFDLPYWPAHNHPNYKEVWVHPVSRWFWIMADLAGPALVEGHAKGAVEFRETAAGQTLSATPDFATGRFRAWVPEGHYTVRSGAIERSLTLLPASTARLDLRPGHTLDFAVSNDSARDGRVTIRVSARGNGAHRFQLRAANLAFAEPVKEARLDAAKAQTLAWQTQVKMANAPWVAVVVPDEDPSQRKEAFGK